MTAETRFEQAVGHVFALEGGYVDHPSDPGGATNLGITRRALAEWRGVVPWQNLPKTAVRDLKKSEAAEVYHHSYWVPAGCDQWPAGLDLCVFDFAVHSGPRRAVASLQALVGATADGLSGPQTRAAVSTFVDRDGLEALINAYVDRRNRFLHSLSTYETFGRGWNRRIARIRSWALAAANQISPATRESSPMNLLNGYKTYIIAAAMLVAGLAQLAGVDLPGFEDKSALNLVLESLAIVFLRHGVAKLT